jgi:hypothetical protein
MLAQNFKNDLKISLNAVWIIISLIIITVLLLSVFYPELLLSAAPVCFSKVLYKSECFMCGMTRAFVEISKGNFSSAITLNNLSLILYSAFAFNTFVFFFYIFQKIKRIIFISKKQLTH